MERSSPSDSEISENRFNKTEKRVSWSSNLISVREMTPQTSMVEIVLSEKEEIDQEVRQIKEPPSLVNCYDTKNQSCPFRIPEDRLLQSMDRRLQSVSSLEQERKTLDDSLKRIFGTNNIVWWFNKFDCCLLCMGTFYCFWTKNCAFEGS